MKSASSVNYRRRKRFGKILFLIVILLLGILVSFETRMHIFSLKNIEIEPKNIIPESVVWNNVTQVQRHFWLALRFSSANYAESLSRIYPVECKVSILSWGIIKLQVSVIEPSYQLLWKNHNWYVSKNGKIWRSDIPENNILTLKKLAAKPSLYWNEDRVSPYEIGGSNGNIKDTALPISNITGWYDSLKTAGWLNKIQVLKTETNESNKSVRIIFKKHNNEQGMSILMPDESDKWPVICNAVNKICPDVQSLSSDDFIDATYKNKILLKNAVQ